jgi:hypothetical protein
VVGGGIVGVRAARELLGPGPDGRPTTAAVTLVSRRSERRQQLAGTFGPDVELRAEPDWSPAGRPDVVLIARTARDQVDVARRAVESGCHVVATADDPDAVGELLALDGAARTAGVTVAVGVAMSPGLSCLLARLAATSMDAVDEVHVARAGAAGPACARQRLRALRGTAAEWRDGAWVRRAGFSGRELCWFPDPVGARDCFRAELSEPAVLVPAIDGVSRVSARLVANRRDRAFAVLPVLVGPPPEGGPGAIRVEVRGRRDGERVVAVHGAFDRPGVAAAAAAAVTALWIARQGAFAGWPVVPAGAAGLAGLGDPRPALRELARRGVRTATFEGTAGGATELALGAQVGGECADTTTERERS